MRVANHAQSFQPDALDQIGTLDVEPGMMRKPAISALQTPSNTVWRSFHWPFSRFQRCGERKVSASRMK